MIDKEKILLLRARQGDLEAFETLIEGYHKKVYNIALAASGNRESAVRLAQGVFVEVFKSIKDIKEDSFSVCIYKTAGEFCRREIKKQKAFGVAVIGRMI